MQAFIEVTSDKNGDKILINIVSIIAVFIRDEKTVISTRFDGYATIKESYEEVKRKMEEAVDGRTKVRKSETNPSRFTITLVRNKNKNGKYEVSQDDIQRVVNMACYRALGQITDEYIEQDMDEATPITPMFQFEEEEYND